MVKPAIYGGLVFLALSAGSSCSAFNSHPLDYAAIETFAQGVRQQAIEQKAPIEVVSYAKQGIDSIIDNRVSAAKSRNSNPDTSDLRDLRYIVEGMEPLAAKGAFSQYTTDIAADLIAINLERTAKEGRGRLISNLIGVLAASLAGGISVGVLSGYLQGRKRTSVTL